MWGRLMLEEVRMATSPLFSPYSSHSPPHPQNSTLQKKVKIDYYRSRLTYFHSSNKTRAINTLQTLTRANSTLFDLVLTLYSLFLTWNISWPTLWKQQEGSKNCAWKFSQCTHLPQIFYYSTQVFPQILFVVILRIQFRCSCTGRAKALPVRAPVLFVCVYTHISGVCICSCGYV